MNTIKSILPDEPELTEEQKDLPSTNKNEIDQNVDMPIKQSETILFKKDKIDFTYFLQSEDGFTRLQRMGKMLAYSTLLPDEFKNNISNCIMLLMLAIGIGIDPARLAQNSQIIRGRLTFSAKFLIERFNICGKFTPIKYTFSGAPYSLEWTCIASSIDKKTGEPLIGMPVSLQLAKDEGWLLKNGSKWKTMPEQMLKYRSASFLINAYAPEVVGGLYITEEVEDYVAPTYHQEQKNGRAEKVIADMKNVLDAESFDKSLDEETKKIENDIEEAKRKYEEDFNSEHHK